MLSSNLLKVNFKFSKSGPELKFPFYGGRGAHGMHGTGCCHLACIWSELPDFDTKFCNTFSVSASQIVSWWRLRIPRNTSFLYDCGLHILHICKPLGTQSRKPFPGTFLPKILENFSQKKFF